MTIRRAVSKEELRAIAQEQMRLELERRVDEGLEDPGLLDNDLEYAGDMAQPVNVSAPSKDQHHCGA